MEFCYWARLNGFGGSVGEIIANGNASGPVIVEIANTDVGFESSGCGQWEQIGTSVVLDSAGGSSACFLFGKLLFDSNVGNVLSTLGDTLRVIQSSAEAADEAEIRSAAAGMLRAESEPNTDLLAIHMDSMQNACMRYYLSDYTRGLIYG